MDTKSIVSGMRRLNPAGVALGSLCWSFTALLAWPGEGALANFVAGAAFVIGYMLFRTPN